MPDRSDVAVLGAGVAGLAAAAHAARLGLTVRVIDRMGPGGQVVNAGELDAVPGLAAGTIGADLIGRLTEQAVERDVEIEFGDVVELAVAGDSYVVRTDAGEFESSAVIVALGTRPTPLGVPGEDELIGLGVSHCAQCDGDLYRDRDVVVVGGGDAALEAAAHLSSRARAVTIVHRGSAFGGAAQLIERATSPVNVTVRWGTTVRSLTGNGHLQGVVIKGEDAEEELAADGIFPEIGRLAQNEPVDGLVELDATGRIVVDASMGTSRAGVFAVGSARAGAAGQVVTSMADGVVAAVAAATWLSSAARP